MLSIAVCAQCDSVPVCPSSSNCKAAQIVPEKDGCKVLKVPYPTPTVPSYRTPLQCGDKKHPFIKINGDYKPTNAQAVCMGKDKVEDGDDETKKTFEYTVDYRTSSPYLLQMEVRRKFHRESGMRRIGYVIDYRTLPSTVILFSSLPRHQSTREKRNGYRSKQDECGTMCRWPDQVL